MRGNDLPCIAFENAVAPEDVAKILAVGEAAQQKQASVDGAPPEHRECAVAWLEDQWLLGSIERLVRDINATFYGFDLGGLAEPLQYTVYEPGGHYGWHMDMGPGTVAPRKLSLTVQLSDPQSYEGGEFEVRMGAKDLAMPKGIGTVLAFPSFVLHRVTQITRGTRRSLVVWAHGPAFR